MSERGRAFEAVGETAKALAKVGSTSGIVAALPKIADCIKDALPHMSRNRSTGFSLEALEVSRSIHAHGYMVTHDIKSSEGLSK